jgi:hypothetical protein
VNAQTGDVSTAVTWPVPIRTAVLSSNGQVIYVLSESSSDALGVEGSAPLEALEQMPHLLFFGPQVGLSGVHGRHDAGHPFLHPHAGAFDGGDLLRIIR